MADTHLMLACRHCGSRILIGKGYNGSYHTVCDDLSSRIDTFFSEHERGACADDFDCENNARNHFIVLEDDENLNSLKEELWRREGALKMLDQLNVDGLLNMTPRAYWELRDRTAGCE